MKNNYFICSTKYQLFNCINIIHNTYSEDKNNIIIIYLNEKLSKELYLLSCKSKVFSSVVLFKISTPNYKKKSSIQFVKYYINVILKIIFSKNIVKIRNKKVDNIFITFTDVFSKIIAYEFIKKYNANLFFYEDGLASYYNIISINPYNKKNTLLKLRFGFYLFDRCQGIYLYEPKYLISNPFNITVLKIPKLHSNGSYEKKLYHFMSLDKDYKDKDKDSIYIFFDGYSNIKEYNDLSIKLIELISNKLNKTLYIKYHPSKNTVTYNIKNTNVYENNDSIEIENLIYSKRNQVLISVISTACITPKLIFNEEPTVILLYKLFNNYEYVWGEINKIFDIIKNSYTDQSKFFVPETVAELMEFLNNLN